MQEGQKKKRKCDHRNRGRMMSFKDGGRSYQPRDAVSSRKQKGKEMSLP